MTTALITGVTGQDGAYLAKLLLGKGYEVFGTFRRLSTPNFWRLQEMDIIQDVHLIPCDLIDATSLAEALRVSKPQEVYHLAAQSFVGASFEQPVGTGDVTGLAVPRMLEPLRQMPGVRFYQASTSELYGRVAYSPQNEETPFHPQSPYAAAKLYAYWMVRIYREAYGLFATNGILFNHESPLRGLEFVTRKISNAVARIKLGLDEKLVLGNLDARRDWGYAPEYVESMWLMLQQDEPGDFVIATNETRRVGDFVEAAFSHVGLDWREHVQTDERYKRPLEVDLLQGDASQAEKKLGWKPRTKFKDLVRIMVDADLSRWERWERGERFPWDAPSYPNEHKIRSRKYKYDA